MGDSERHAGDPVVVEHDGEEDLLELLVRNAPLAERLDGIVIGVLAGIDGTGSPRVAFPGCPGATPVPARSLIALDAAAEGREVALMFEAGDPHRPVVLGLIQDPTAFEFMPDGTPADAPAAPPVTSPQADIDGETVTFTAEKEIVLRCGRASITLTRAGKILIRGAYLSSRSSGVNRIKGGSVQIN
jgi:hypothetical protein